MVTQVAERAQAAVTRLLLAAFAVGHLRERGREELGQSLADVLRVAGSTGSCRRVRQSLGQLVERYARGADSVLANSTATLFMEPITDGATRIR